MMRRERNRSIGQRIDNARLYRGTLNYSVVNTPSRRELSWNLKKRTRSLKRWRSCEYNTICGNGECVR